LNPPGRLTLIDASNFETRASFAERARVKAQVRGGHPLRKQKRVHNAVLVHEDEERTAVLRQGRLLLGAREHSVKRAFDYWPAARGGQDVHF
jgi:hypothetical protein